MRKDSPSPPDPFDPSALERLVEGAERDPRASEELDFLADLVAAAELEREALAPEPAQPTAPLLRRPWLLPLAASVLFLLALGAWLVTRSGEHAAPRAVAQREAPLYVAAELRSPDGPQEAFQTAMEPYARGTWSAAAESLTGFLASHPDHGPAHFYLGAVREQLGALDSAAEEYGRAVRGPDALLAEHARFRLAELWLARGETERARAELQALAAQQGELARNARELLDELGAR